MTKGHCKILVFYTFSGLVAIGSLVFFLVGMSCAFLYLFDSYPVSNSSCSSVDKCDVFEGSWIRDERYPLYNASQCPFAEIGFYCFANGHKDGGYAKWRWKPKNCDILRFDVRTVLEKHRGKGVEDKNCVYEVNGNKITIVFLVQLATVPIRSRKRVKSTLRVDKLDDTSQEWIDYDILIFDSRHWRTPSKLFDMGCYFQVGKSLKLGMPITTGFRTALNSWASWVETMVDTYRTFESSHWSGRNRISCKVTQHPWSSSWGKGQSTISDIIIKIVRKMKVPVTILHITPMVSFRSDGHVGTWSNNASVPDCSHWCPPGVPDMWNEIFLNLLPMNQVPLNEV